MLKIYGVYQSRASRAYWLAIELGIPFESIPVIQARRLEDPKAPGAQINTHSPEFLALAPYGKIPVIVDDDVAIDESMAINLYLARKHGGPLAPSNLREEAQMLQWSFWAVNEIEQQSVKIVLTYDNGEQDSPVGRETIAVAERLLKKPFARLNAHLDAHDFVVGDRFTVADINLAEIIRYAMSQKALFDANPNVAAWLTRCHARPAFAEMMERRKAEG